MQQAELDAYRALVQRRAKREPVAYLVGSKGFHAIDLKVDRRVLIPRPRPSCWSTSIALFGDNKAPRFVDIGTGSGAIRVGCVDGSARSPCGRNGRQR